jgi:iron complex transport system substrate-binding protein
VLLVPSLGLQSLGGARGLLAQPGVALTPAGRAGRVVELDDLLLLGFGPRTGQAVTELTRRLHPELGPKQ